VILLQSLLEHAADINPHTPDFKRLIDLCYSCRRCISACPAGIPIPDLMAHARHAYLKAGGPGGLTLGHRIYANYGRFDRLGSATAPFSNWMTRRKSVRKLIEWLTHIDSRALLPTFSRQTFEAWFHNRPASRKGEGKKAVYFVDSYANYNDPSLGKAVVSILEHLGYDVIVPPQKESGMPAVEYGLMEEARQLAEYNVHQLVPYARDGWRIVCSSPAASYLLKEGYGTILDTPDWRQVSGATVDMAELLLEEYEAGRANFVYNGEILATYHYCCLAKSLGLGRATTKLLEAAGIRSVQNDDCCGGAGVWGTFRENYDISAEIAEKLVQKIDPHIPLLTESETCRLQIEAHSSAQVLFPLQLLGSRIRGLQVHQT